MLIHDMANHSYPIPAAEIQFNDRTHLQSGVICNIAMVRVLVILLHGIEFRAKEDDFVIIPARRNQFTMKMHLCHIIHVTR